MHKSVMLVIVASALASGAAVAQQQIRPTERYCLEAASGRSGSQPLMCRYETMEQCLASKTGVSDRCMLNPWLVGRPVR